MNRYFKIPQKKKAWLFEQSEGTNSLKWTILHSGESLFEQSEGTDSLKWTTLPSGESLFEQSEGTDSLKWITLPSRELFFLNSLKEQIPLNESHFAQVNRFLISLKEQINYCEYEEISDSVWIVKNREKGMIFTCKLMLMQIQKSRPR